MTSSASRPARAWSLLTDIPGRSDASAAARCGRAVPLLLPLLVLIALAGWKWGVQDPRVRAARIAAQPVLNLESEVAALQSHRSPAGPETSGRAAALRAALPHGRGGLPSVLGSWQAQATVRGWEAVFGPLADLPGGSGASLAQVAVRGAFRPLAGNLHSWNSLLGLLGDFSAPDARIGVTRLAIRADEQGRYSVEMRLNLPYLAETPAYVK